jgi:hypothetical protein
MQPISTAHTRTCIRLFGSMAYKRKYTSEKACVLGLLRLGTL